MKWKIAGFSSRRVALVVAILSLALVPIHFFVSCEMSGLIWFCGKLLIAITGVLTMIDASGKMAFPLTLAVIALIGHLLFTH